MSFRFSNLSLFKQITWTLVAMCLVTTVAQFFVQHMQYSSSFGKIFQTVRQGAIQQKQSDAQAILREVLFATNSSLQRGEKEVFMGFARQQKSIEEIEEFSFLGKTGKVELSSNPQAVNRAIDAQLWNKLRQSSECVVQENDDQFNFYQPLRIDADMRRLDPTSRVGDVYGALYLQFSKAKINAMVAEASDSYAKASRWTVGIALFTALLTISLAVGAGSVVVRGIVRPLLKGVAFAKSVAAGDLTQTLNIDRRDEIGQLSVALGHMVKQLRDVFGQITGTVGRLANSSTGLVQTATQLAGGAEEATSQSAQVAAAAEQMSTNMGNVAASTEEMSTNIKVVASAVDQLTSSIGEVAKSAERTAGVAGNAAQLVATSNTQIGELGGAADEIGKVIEVIQDIAEQTNLLALNATIEAARAGDAGKGFAVVATEVKDLARQTASATDDIRRRIEGIQVSSGRAVQSIGEISEVVKQVNELSQVIASAVEEQSITTKEIGKNMLQSSTAAQTVARGVAESATATQEITRNIVRVDEAAKQAAVGAAQTQTAGHELSQVADQLQSLVAQFTVS
jgi:methyl-accepting chemotaxis protein